VAGRRVEDNEVLVRVIGCAMVDGIREQGEAAAGNRRRRGTLKAGPIAEQAGAEGVAERDEFSHFRVRGREAPHVVRRGEGVSLERAHEPPLVVRHDKVAEAAGIGGAVRLGTGEVGDYQFTGTGYHVG
jgi:hypothetical protein